MNDSGKAMEIAVLGGGCFWCLEAVFMRLQGVSAVASGYCGGHLHEPAYTDVCRGDSGHAEVVRIEFDPRVLPFTDLLAVFFAIHDPTTPDRQGNDVGSQYRSAIFCQNDSQLAIARQSVVRLTADGVFASPIVTQIVALPAPPFYPAETEHARYFERHGNQPYCRLVVAPKVEKFKALFAARAKDF